MHGMIFIHSLLLQHQIYQKTDTHQAKRQRKEVAMSIAAFLHHAPPQKAEEFLFQQKLKCLLKKHHFHHVKRHQEVAAACFSQQQDAAFFTECAPLKAKQAQKDILYTQLFHNPLFIIIQ